MCVGVPARIVEIVDAEHGLAKADARGVVRDVSLALLDAPVGVGDWILLHLGFASGTLDASEAEDTLRFLDDLDLGRA